ncbi:MAG: GTPase ObgE [Planctomycetota bacterium]
MRMVSSTILCLLGLGMFIDGAEIYTKAGDGGPGCVSFRRERFLPRGGPDGGNGGDGGSVILVATAGVDTLLDFKGKHDWKSRNGRPGKGKNMTGESAADLVIPVPLGTLVYDRDTGLLIKDLAEVGDSACVARGGRGGRGNKSFATPTHQVPRESGPGEPGEERWLRLELKLIADVGLIGLPNAGKSTLLSRLSEARPKIAAYPFTTLEPQLGIVELSGYRRFVMADLPGLIEGAHRGAGLGDTFLRHIERTRVVLHLIDVAPPAAHPCPVEAYRIVRRELASYSAALAEKPELVVLNKLDLLPQAVDPRTDLEAEVGCKILTVSAVAGTNLPALLEQLWEYVAHNRQVPVLTPGPVALADPVDLS